MKLDKYEIGKRYGKALFQLSLEKDCIKQTYDELLTLKTIFNENKDLGKMMDAVHTNVSLKENIFKELTTPFSPLVQHFLMVVYRYRRLEQLLIMIDYFEKYYDEHSHHLRGIVKSVVPLSNEQLLKIEQSVSNLLGYKEVTLTNQLDDSIIGGFVIEAHNYIIDRSLQQKIKTLARTLNV